MAGKSHWYKALTFAESIRLYCHDNNGLMVLLEESS